uniref:Uncharacterized protein n=1 Tax=Quercus lobata TaxID=97700 RepID=A0A7N2R3W2_QUELO
MSFIDTSMAYAMITCLPYIFHAYCTSYVASLEGTKHSKSLANTAIAKDLVQPETMYGRLDAHLDVEVIPCEMRPGTVWTMSLIPCWLKCWMSANGALLYQWNSLFCFHLCSLPSLLVFVGPEGLQSCKDQLREVHIVLNHYLLGQNAILQPLFWRLLLKLRSIYG